MERRQRNSKNEIIADENSKYLQFSLGDDQYAIKLLNVQEVIPVPEISKLPNISEYFMGVTNLRGKIIPIVDFRLLLNSSSNTKELEEAVIIVDFEDQGIGLLVDSINKVLVVLDHQFEYVTSIKNELKSNYIKGIFNSSDEMTILLNLKKILDENFISEVKNKIA